MVSDNNSFNSKIDLFAEASYIFKSSYLLPRDWSNLKGYRFLFQPRYFLGDDRDFFLAGEFRLKHQSFLNKGKLSFTNDVNSRDTFSISNFRESQNLIGGAILFGKQLSLEDRERFFFEITAGIGVKQRIINYKNNVPDNYKNNLLELRGYALAPSYQRPETTFYLPIALRLFWKLK